MAKNNLRLSGLLTGFIAMFGSVGLTGELLSEEPCTAADAWRDPVMEPFFMAQWEQLHASSEKQRAAEKFREMRFGMFIHWGLYAIPAGVWNGERMEDGGDGPVVAEWVMRRKRIPRDEYEDLADQFNPIHFDAERWVDLAKRAGMRYLVITAKHHDGFALFDSDTSSFNVVDATPFGRDVIRELNDACEKAGLAFGVYYSHSLDWRDGGDGGVRSYGPRPLCPCPKVECRQARLFPNLFDPSPQTFDEYISDKSLPQVKELLRGYDLSVLWLDTPLHIPAKFSYLFYKTIYDANPSILISERIGNGMGDIGTPGDNILPDSVENTYWETIATMNDSWGYKSYDHNWKSAQEVVYWLVSSASKGGNLMLNVGPDAQGRIPPESVRILEQVGRWLDVNGEAVYGTHSWQNNYEGPGEWTITEENYYERKEEGFVMPERRADEFWFTAKGDDVYLVSFKWPADSAIVVRSLDGAGFSRVNLLGFPAELEWRKVDGGVRIRLPDGGSGIIGGDIGYVLRFSDVKSSNGL